MLRSKNILLRACEPDDLPLMYEWENNTSNWLLSDTVKPFSKYTLGEFIQQDQSDIFTTKQQRFVIQLFQPLKTIGFIDLYQYDPVHRRAGVGILIGDETERKKGYAAESIECLKNYARQTLNLHQLFCYIQASNKASIKLFQQSGFTSVGVLKDWLIYNQKPEDVMLYQHIL
ncbi:MAG: Spermidine N(1)-acetyltransferase [Bacteroidetes bacterium ADurb.Bin141]|nr:MAG: N-acetyltransferase GCN5 [Bacteroidetes bacterium OLB10]MCE7955231.1 N-acetyltransferase [Bacteroidetes bacterium CHB6]OQB65198.1 MAG: Spermidine N(1)-acetyltransferase [Bacteroidetes bacterium ADurb.Bin141]